MRAHITSNLIDKLKPDVRQYDVWDTKLSGFHVRVQRNGRKFYRCYYARNRIKSIGSTELFTLAEAREYAMTIIVTAKNDNLNLPHTKKQQNKNTTLAEFVQGHYGEWRLANRKTAQKDLERIKSIFFTNFGNKILSEILPADIEIWRTKRLNNNIKPATINRDLCILKSLLSTAVTWDIIEKNPISKIKPLKIDNAAKVRFLNNIEEQVLRDTITKREQRLKQLQKNTNKYNGDHLKPMVLLSINTGIRRGELLSLTWDNIDLQHAMLTITGSTTKTGKTRHIPLNKEALQVIKQWQKTTNAKCGLIFPNKNGCKFANIHTAWKKLLKSAKIENFRWHDLRHHFASKLVMAGVDLNTVRELLGHSDIKMTLRYAHLAPEHKAQAVAKLLD